MKKKGLLLTIVSLILFIWAIFSLIQYVRNKEERTRLEYINECVQNMREFNVSEQAKEQACACAYDYLYPKYGDAVYKTTFILPTAEDSTYVQNCMLKAMDK